MMMSDEQVIAAEGEQNYDESNDDANNDDKCPGDSSGRRAEGKPSIEVSCFLFILTLFSFHFSYSFHSSKNMNAKS